MCTLLDGEGKMREIWIALCYALFPTILLGAIGILLSNVLAQGEALMCGKTVAEAALELKKAGKLPAFLCAENPRFVQP